MKADCPVCRKEFELDLDSGDVRCPHCSAPLRAEAFGETQSIDVGSESGEGSGSGQTRKTSRLRVKLLPEDAPESRPAGPQEFAGYRILEELGRGGMGVVYKAQDPKLDRTVAIKVLLSAEHASAGDVGRFFREALSVAKLQHPNIVPIYEMKTHDGRHYFTMDYVEGQPLDRFIREKRPGLRRSLELVEKVALALHHAHSRGVVHRDLKPANIIIDQSGEPKVTDFGLAKTVSSEGHKGERDLTKTGLAIGTPHYMAPEQAAGRSKEADARTDVYSLGCVLYELVSGKPPFQGASTVDVLQKHIDEMPVPPAGRGPRLPEDVATICMKCLEKEPARRYHSAEQLANDIRNFLDGGPIAARRASVVYLVKHQIIRHKALALVVAAALGLLIAATVAYIAGLRRERNLFRRQLYYSDIALAQRHAQEANVGHVDQLLNACPPDMRGWEWQRVWREAHQEVLSTGRLAAAPSRVGFSADGKKFFAVVDTQKLTFDAASAKLLSAEDAPQQERRSLKVNGPDGKFRATVEEDGYVRVTHPGYRLSALFRPHERGVQHMFFGKNGLLITTGTDKTICAWKFGRTKTRKPPKKSPGKAVKKLPKPPAKPPAAKPAKPPAGGGAEPGAEGAAPGPPGPGPAAEKKPPPAEDESLPHKLLGRSEPQRKMFTFVKFAPRGGTLVTGDVAGAIRIWRLPRTPLVKLEWKPWRTLLGHTADVNKVVFDPARRRLASCSVDRTIRIWDARTFRPLLRLRGHADTINDIAFSRDGRRVVSSSDDRTVKVWDAVRLSTQVVLRPEAGPVTSLLFHPRERRLYAGATRGISVYDPLRGEGGTKWRNESGRENILAISPDGRMLASGGSGGLVRLRDLAGGRVVKQLKFVGVDYDVLAMAFDPSGRHLAAAGSRGEVRIWSVVSGRQLPRLSGHRDVVRALAFSPDGKYVASGGDDRRVIVWDAAKCSRIRLMVDAMRTRRGSTWAITFSPDGKRLAAAFMNRIQIEDVVTGRNQKILHGHAVRVYALAFSPDGRRLASAGKDGTVRLWDAETGRELLNLRGHTDWVTAVAFGPNGKMLASSSRDGSVRVWLAGDWSSSQRTDK